MASFIVCHTVEEKRTESGYHYVRDTMIVLNEEFIISAKPYEGRRMRDDGERPSYVTMTNGEGVILYDTLAELRLKLFNR